jgi:hypothetical protein
LAFALFSFAFSFLREAFSPEDNLAAILGVILMIVIQ